MPKTSTKELGEKMQEFGKRLTIGLTMPIFFFILGLFTMPLGIMFWIIGFLLLTTLFASHAKTESEDDKNN